MAQMTCSAIRKCLLGVNTYNKSTAIVVVRARGGQTSSELVTLWIKFEQMYKSHDDVAVDRRIDIFKREMTPIN